jgi:hypothetical protein
MIASGPTSLFRLVRPDIEDAQQIGCSDLQNAELDPGLAEVFVTVSGLSLSPTLTLCYYRSHILRANINTGAVQGRFARSRLVRLRETGF